MKAEVNSEAGLAGRSEHNLVQDVSYVQLVLLGAPVDLSQHLCYALHVMCRVKVEVNTEAGLAGRSEHTVAVTDDVDISNVQLVLDGASAREDTSQELQYPQTATGTALTWQQTLKVSTVMATSSSTQSV